MNTIQEIDSLIINKETVKADGYMHDTIRSVRSRPEVLFGHNKLMGMMCHLFSAIQQMYYDTDVYCVDDGEFEIICTGTWWKSCNTAANIINVLWRQAKSVDIPMPELSEKAKENDKLVSILISASMSKYFELNFVSKGTVKSLRFDIDSDNFSCNVALTDRYALMYEQPDEKTDVLIIKMKVDKKVLDINKDTYVGINNIRTINFNN